MSTKTSKPGLFIDFLCDKGLLLATDYQLNHYSTHSEAVFTDATQAQTIFYHAKSWASKLGFVMDARDNVLFFYEYPF